MKNARNDSEVAKEMKGVIWCQCHLGSFEKVNVTFSAIVYINIYLYISIVTF